MFCTRVLIYSEDDSKGVKSDSEEFVGTRNSPSSYRQPNGRGQSLSRRYCTQSGWLFSCAERMASSSHGALAVSCKYFKQSK
jgi:hypothetical protein